MVTRKAAEEQAEQCFLYHAGLYALTVAGLTGLGHRSTSTIATLWGLGVAAHGLMLYGLPQSREWILRQTAAGMEDRRIPMRPSLRSTRPPVTTP
jgi:hypothetical protein